MDQSASVASGIVPTKGGSGLVSRRRRSRGPITASTMIVRSVSTPMRVVIPPAGYLRAVRLGTVWLGLAPALVALALLWAQGLPIEPLPAISAVVAVALALLGANVLDQQREHGLDASDTLSPLSGKPQVALPLVSRPTGKLLIGLAALVGLPAALAGGSAVLTLGAAGLLAAFFYSATSHPWKRLPGSELVVVAALGPGVMAATVVGQGRGLGPVELLLGAALGLVALAVTEMAHLRDAPVHAASGRRTLVTLLGLPRSKLLCAAVLLGAVAAALLAAAMGRGAAEGAALSLLALPSGLVALISGLRATTSSARHAAYDATLRAYAHFALWLLAGIVLVGLLLRVAPHLVP